MKLQYNSLKMYMFTTIEKYGIISILKKISIYFIYLICFIVISIFLFLLLIYPLSIITFKLTH